MSRCGGAVVWVACAACVGPPLRPVAPPSPGEVVITASVQGPDLVTGTAPLEVGATAAVGLAPHWAIQAEAGWDPSLDWVVGGGLRYTRPIDDWQSVDLSASYDQVSARPVRSCPIFAGFGGSGSGGGSASTGGQTSFGYESVEAGLLFHKPSSALWTGVWFDAVVGQSNGTGSCFVQSGQANGGAGLRLGFDIAPSGSFLHLLLGASALVPANFPAFFGGQQQNQETSQQLSSWFSAGLGLAAYF